MINAELSYNPYLMETQVRFNGQPPRVNSLVEKYQNMNLQSWMNRIPRIFHDEMNGYYFELDFTGPQLDYEDLCNTFRRIGVKDDVVPIVQKVLLEDRNTKQNRVDDLLKWLEENPNHRFDYDAFKAENPDLFEGGYSYIYLHGRGLNGDVLKDMNVSVEYVDTVEELKDTDLYYTPILIYITENTLPVLESELSYFKGRQDVSQEQLFFLIGGILDQNIVSRVIRDLGVVSPKIVEMPDAPAVRKYIEVYPVTAFVKEALDILRNEAGVIGIAVEEENEKSVAVNRAIHEKIDEIDASIERLRNANSFYTEYAELKPMTSVDEMGEELVGKVNDWRKKRTAINKTEEAIAAALEFEKEVAQWLLGFAEKAGKETVNKIQGIKRDFEAEYERTEYDDFVAETQSVEIPEMEKMKSFYTELLDMKETKQVEAKEDLLGMLFKTHQTEEKEKVLVTTYFYQKWRDHVASLVQDAIDRYRDQLFQVYKEYAEELRSVYLNYTADAIDKEEHKKNEVSSQLSEDERLLQADNDWLRCFNEQRSAIERG